MATRLGTTAVPLYGIVAGTVAVDPPSQGAAGFFSFTATVSGAAVGDVIVLHPPDTLENTLRLVGYAITAVDTVTIRMEATAVVDGLSRTWEFVLYDLTRLFGE